METMRYPREAATGVELPLVTVIIPIHNTYRYLAQCLNSVLYQTLRNIEVICIDDASTDASLAYANYRASLDKRVSVYSMTENCGAGTARNIGLDHARGKYLYFLDSDDFIEHALLEDAVKVAEQHESEVVVFKLRQVSAVTLRSTFASWAFRTENMPQAETFAASDMATRIFNTFQTWPHNKMFLRSFIEQNGIRFQELHRTNDLLFVYTALAHARRITPFHQFGINYRVDMTQNSQATNHLHPVDFCNAFVALKERLAADGLLDTYKLSLQNAFLGGSIYNLSSQKKRESFDILFNALRNDYFGQFDLDEMPEREIVFKDEYKVYQQIMEQSDPSELYSIASALA